VLQAIASEAMAIADGRAVIVSGSNIQDAATGESLGAAPSGLETVVVKQPLARRTRWRAGRTETFVARPRNPAACAKELQGSDNEDLLPVLQAALTKESIPA